MTIDVIITICVALAATALASLAIVRAFMRVDKINKVLEEYNKELSKAQLDLEEANDRVETYKQESIELRKQLGYYSDIISGLEDSLIKAQCRCAELERDKSRTPVYYIQLKWNTPDDPGWEHLTKDLFYTRRAFRSLREAAKEAKRQVKNPLVVSARILKTKERVLGKKEWRDLV
jgi:septal ring factor EnvC (AmiA/AmiB activator)